MIYLLHFDTPLAHARHYVGFSENGHTLPARIEHHRRGTSGARIMEVLNERNIGFQVAAVWEGDRTLERKLHKRGKSHICPLCNPTAKFARLKPAGRRLRARLGV